MVEGLLTAIQEIPLKDLTLEAFDRPEGMVAKLKSALGTTTAIQAFPTSFRWHNGAIYFVCAFPHLCVKRLVCLSRPDYVSPFLGEVCQVNDLLVHELPMSWENALQLHKTFPFTKPVSLREKEMTVGCGDRLGLCTAGHIQAMKQHGEASPVLAQQSMRELSLTGRTFKAVVADVSFQVFQEGFERGYGADGDHLKTLADIDAALEAEMPMITLDMSEKLHPERVTWSPQQLRLEFERLSKQEQGGLLETFLGQKWLIDGDAYSFDVTAIHRCAALYREAIAFAKQVDSHIQKCRGKDYDLEISIDETSFPTTPADHLFVAVCLTREQVNFTSLAPRFVGEFQKAIDYIGNIDQFEAQLRKHVAIARHFDTYKISIHSGSDKYSVFGIIGRCTRGLLHLKTSGTSWLEAVRVVASKNPHLYRELHRRALQFFPEAARHYHVKCDPKDVLDVDSVRDQDLANYLDDDDSRQLIHISYGGILADPKLRADLFATLYANLDALAEAQCKNIHKHLVHLQYSPPTEVH